MNTHRPGGIGDVSDQTIANIRTAMQNSQRVPGDPDVIAKATTQGWQVGTGAVGLLLEPRLVNLWPALAPLRNRFSRHNAPNGATAVQWRAITGLNVAGLLGGVADGLRNAFVSTAERDRRQSFASLGYDDFVTFDAQDSAANIYDLRAEASANLLVAVMSSQFGEEGMTLGGNVTALGRPTFVNGSITDAAAGVAGPFTAATQYDYALTALTYNGYSNGAAGHVAADALYETQGQTVIATRTTSGGITAQILQWAAVRGAVAYNLYIGAHSGTLYYAGTTTATRITVTTAAGAATVLGTRATYSYAAYGTPMVVATLPGAGGVPNTSDQTAEALSFDGLLPQLELPGGVGSSPYWDATVQYNGGGYMADLNGASYTSDGGNGIVELDVMLKSLWDNSRIGPTALFVNSQEGQDWGRLIVQAGAAVGTYRMVQNVAADGSVQGGLVATAYRNKFTFPEIIPIFVHPYLPPSTALAISEKLPFPRANIANPFEYEVLREYTQYDWAQVQRRYEFGIYLREALKVYFPAGCGVIVGNSHL